MFKLLITTFNCGIPTNSVVENFETMQQLQNAARPGSCKQAIS